MYDAQSKNSRTNQSSLDKCKKEIQQYTWPFLQIALVQLPPSFPVPLIRHLPSVCRVHPTVLAEALKFRVRHAAPRLVLQGSAEAEYPPPLQQGG